MGRLLALILVLQSVFANGRNETAAISRPSAPTNVRIESVMLHNTVRWDSIDGENLTYTVWLSLEDCCWEEESNCKNIRRHSCMIDEIMLVIMEYKVYVVANNSDGVVSNRSEIILFRPEHHTTLLAPLMEIERREEIVFVRSQTPLVHTGEKISDHLMTLVYQIKMWPRDSQDKVEIVNRTMDATEFPFEIDDSYCFQIRLFAEEYYAINVTSGNGMWSDEQCVDEYHKSNNYIARIIVVSIIACLIIIAIAVVIGCVTKCKKLRKMFSKTDMAPPAQLIELVRSEKRQIDAEARSGAQNQEQEEVVDKCLQLHEYAECEGGSTNNNQGSERKDYLLSPSMAIHENFDEDSGNANLLLFETQPNHTNNIDNLAYSSNIDRDIPDVLCDGE